LLQLSEPVLRLQQFQRMRQSCWPLGVAGTGIVLEKPLI
jgi:hypothetical protein